MVIVLLANGKYDYIIFWGFRHRRHHQNVRHRLRHQNGCRRRLRNCLLNVCRRKVLNSWVNNFLREMTSRGSNFWVNCIADFLLLLMLPENYILSERLSHCGYRKLLPALWQRSVIVSSG